MKKIVFIAWASFHRRSELLAQHFGASIHYVYAGQMGKLSQAPVRYMIQAWRTWQILRQQQPEVILVQNPPIFAVFVAFLYAKFYGAKYVIDSHTGAFLSSKWRWSVGVHRMLSRKALMTIVHNTSQENIVKHWGCPYYVLEDPVGDYTTDEKFSFDGKFSAAVVSSFDADEPLEIVFMAAAKLPDVTFYITGNYSRAASTLLRKKPDNCKLTGYIPYPQYIGLLRGADVVIDLVSNAHTLLCGAFEAVSVGTPLIVSDWPVLRDCFSMGTVFVPNTVEGVCEGVHRMQQEQTRLQQEIRLLHKQHQIAWMRKFTYLQRLMGIN